jgi:hypothetical protein
MSSDSTASAHDDLGLNPATRSTTDRGRMTTVPLLDENGMAILFDMYVDGAWHGSQRTLAQCESYFKFIGEQDPTVDRQARQKARR